MLANGLVLSVEHEAGRWALLKRRALIIEHDITVDAELDGIEGVIEAMDLGLEGVN